MLTFVRMEKYLHAPAEPNSERFVPYKEFYNYKKNYHWKNFVPKHRLSMIENDSDSDRKSDFDILSCRRERWQK